MKASRIIVWTGLILLGGSVVLVVFMAAFNRGPQNDSADQRKGIDPATIAAYEKLGAEYGGCQNAAIFGSFGVGPKLAEQGIPGFRFKKKFPNAKLPEVAVPFVLDLSDSDVTDAGLKGLTHLKNLTALMLWGTKVTDAGLKELAPLKNLTAICVDNDTVTDERLRVLREAGLLHALWKAEGRDGTRPKSPQDVVRFEAGGTKVTNAGLRELAIFKNASELSWASAHLDDGTLHVLREIDLLHAVGQAKGKEDARPKSAMEVVGLDLTRTKVTDAGLKELASLKNLTSLSLTSTEVTDEGIKDLAPLQNLKTLILWSTKVTDAGLKDLAPLKNLTSLSLNDQVTDRGLKDLAPLKNLVKLELSSTKVTDAGMKDLAVHENLAVLSLNAAITDGGLQNLAPLKNLESLYLHSTKVTDAGLKELVPFKKLTDLNLFGTLVTNAGLKELASFPMLTKLELRKTKVTNAGVAELQKALPRCKISHYSLDPPETKIFTAP